MNPELDELFERVTRFTVNRKGPGRPAEDEYLRPNRAISLWLRADNIVFADWLKHKKHKSFTKWVNAMIRQTPEYKEFAEMVLPQIKDKIVNPKWEDWKPL